MKREHLIEVKSLGQPPIPVKVTLTGLVIILLDKIKEKGGDIVMTVPQANPGEDPSKKNANQKKEPNYFETAKKYLLNDPRELLDNLLHFDKCSVNQN